MQLPKYSYLPKGPAVLRYPSLRAHVQSDSLRHRIYGGGAYHYCLRNIRGSFSISSSPLRISLTNRALRGLFSFWRQELPATSGEGKATSIDWIEHDFRYIFPCEKNLWLYTIYQPINRYGISLNGEDIMKFRNVALFFVIASLFLSFLPHHAATASAGTTAILTFSHISTDGWGNTLDGVWYTLDRVEGVLKYTIDYDINDALFKATVTFDDTKTTIEKIMETLMKGGYPLQGRPEFLKWSL